MESRHARLNIPVEHDETDYLDFDAATIGKTTDTNADAYFIDAKSRSFGIFDGVGSIKNSAEAARIAASTAEDYLSSESFRQPYDLGKHAVKSALMAAHESILAQGLNGETTAVVAKFYETPSGQPYIAIAHAGDSRAYRLSGAYLDQKTLDHGANYAPSDSAGAMLAQEILANVVQYNGLSDRMMYLHKHRNVVTQVLGRRDHPPRPRVSTDDVQPGQKWLLTTDGVHDNLTTEEIEYVVLAGEAVGGLVRAAYERSLDTEHFRSKRDDITAVLASLK